jgi:hypothetical protein
MVDETAGNVAAPPPRRPRSRSAYIDGIVDSFAQSSFDGLSSPKSPTTPQDRRSTGRATRDATLHDPRLQRTLEQWSRHCPVSPIVSSPLKPDLQKLFALARSRPLTPSRRRH